MHQLYLELKLILVLVGLRADRSLASGRGAQGAGGHDGVAEGSGVGGGGGEGEDEAAVRLFPDAVDEVQSNAFLEGAEGGHGCLIGGRGAVAGLEAPDGCAVELVRRRAGGVEHAPVEHALHGAAGLVHEHAAESRAGSEQQEGKDDDCLGRQAEAQPWGVVALVHA